MKPSLDMLMLLLSTKFTTSESHYVLKAQKPHLLVGVVEEQQN